MSTYSPPALTVVLIGGVAAAATYLVYTAVQAQKRIDKPAETETPTHENDYTKDSPIISIKELSENTELDRYWDITKAECQQKGFDPYSRPDQAVRWLVTFRTRQIVDITCTLNYIMSRVDPKFRPQPSDMKGNKSKAPNETAPPTNGVIYFGGGK